jgi:hypothetical protein
MTITREDLCTVVKAIYGMSEDFIEDVGKNSSDGFEVFCSIGENSTDSDILILNCETGQFVSWYKLWHVGRDIRSNIQNLTDLEKFIHDFKNSMPLYQKKDSV